MLRKKILSLSLAAALILGCAACRKQDETSVTTKAPATSTTAAKEESVTSSLEETTASEETAASTSETTETSAASETSETSAASETASSETSTSETTASDKKVPNAKNNMPKGFGIGKQDDVSAELLKLDRVIGAELRSTSQSNDKVKKYYVIFEMPLDWEHPEKGTFPLRTTFTYVSDSVSNVFTCDGYNLSDYFIEMDDLMEEWLLIKANQITCEHRFFGDSVPEGLSSESLDYWDCLTDENAAADFHHIIGQFKTFLTGKWVFTGGSKGGQLTNMQSHFYPDDADLYLSYVAPGGVSQDAPDFFDFIYTKIGDDKYGEATAKIHREEMLQFQVEAMKLKEKLAPRYYELGVGNGCRFTDFTTPEILYDMAVLEAATITWQYNQDFFTVKRILDSKGSSTFEDDVFNYLVVMNEPGVWSNNDPLFAYYVQAARQNGEHEYDFSYLREALRKEGLENLLTVTEDMEKGLLFKMVFTPEQLEAFTFDPTVYNDMVEWSHTTKSQVIMVYGGADVWYSVRLPDVTDNENIHIYVAKKSSHMAHVFTLEKEEQQEINTLIRKAMGLDS